MKFFLSILLALYFCIACGRTLESDLVYSIEGDLALILTVPHDGEHAIAGVPQRTQGTFGRDLGTRALAERVAAHLEARLGRKPYVVVATFNRKYLDANRPEQDAMQSDAALPAFRAYHLRITTFVAEVKRRFPAGGLLIDLHGQSQVADTLFRGTRDGATVSALLRRVGPDALYSEHSLLGLMAAKGYRVFPPVGNASQQEDPRYYGGYTVSTYGSHQASGLDAIQLEFGKNQRDSRRLADDLADVLVRYLSRYGPQLR